jgi:uncharacterized protein (TIGR03435 family)
MIRTLLEDRFKLTVRHETKEMPVYALTVASGGPKLTTFADGSCDSLARMSPVTPPGQKPSCQRIFGVNPQSHFYMLGNGLTLDEFAQLFNGVFERPVVNQTGLSGVFDLRLDSAMEFTTFCKEPPACDKLLGVPADSPPLIFDAIQQQLGLKLESTKAPVERLVIDRIERPSEN